MACEFIYWVLFLNKANALIKNVHVFFLHLHYHCTEMLKCDSDLQEEELQSLTYDDLLSFSFQVAKGMEFLSAKNVSSTFGS